MRQAQQVAIDATGVVSWRPQGLFYKKNEVYMDILEDVNVLMSAKGQEPSFPRCFVSCSFSFGPVREGGS